MKIRTLALLPLLYFHNRCCFFSVFFSSIIIIFLFLRLLLLALLFLLYYLHDPLLILKKGILKCLNTVRPQFFLLRTESLIHFAQNSPDVILALHPSFLFPLLSSSLFLSSSSKHSFLPFLILPSFSSPLSLPSLPPFFLPSSSFLFPSSSLDPKAPGGRYSCERTKP